jgi:hypothetical protein
MVQIAPAELIQQDEKSSSSQLSMAARASLSLGALCHLPCLGTGQVIGCALERFIERILSTH